MLFRSRKCNELISIEPFIVKNPSDMLLGVEVEQNIEMEENIETKVETKIELKKERVEIVQNFKFKLN